MRLDKQSMLASRSAGTSVCSVFCLPGMHAYELHACKGSTIEHDMLGFAARRMLSAAGVAFV